MNTGMMMKRALGMYGRDRFGSEDAQFNRAILLDLINKEHRDLAARTYCYYQKHTENVPQGSGGLSTVVLDCNVIEIDAYSVRFLNGSTWAKLDYLTEEDLIRDGPYENTTNGTPHSFFLRTGDTVEQNRVLELYPGASAAVTNGVRFGAYIYPAAITADTTGLGIQPAEHYGFLDCLCRAMAQLDLNAGGDGAAARLAYWEGKAEDWISRFALTIRRNRQDDTRKIRYVDCDW
jgi:hypothetical protein